VAALNLAQLLLRRGSAAREARELLLAANHADQAPELRLELLSYGAAHCLAGFEEAAAEIRSLLDSGVRVSPPWDLSRDVGAAKESGNRHAELLEQVAEASHVPEQ
jgi:hypothetical protein